MNQHDIGSRTPWVNEGDAGAHREQSPVSTTGTWIVSVDDERWRALVELLLPPGQIAYSAREDNDVSGELDRSRQRPA